MDDPRRSELRRRAPSSWLRAERERRGHLQARLARDLGVSQQSLSHYENGKVRIPDDVAARLARLWSLSEVDVRRALGLYVPEEMPGVEPLVPLQEFPDDAVRLPKGVKLSDLAPHDRVALTRIMDAYLDSVLERDADRRRLDEEANAAMEAHARAEAAERDESPDRTR